MKFFIILPFFLLITVNVNGQKVEKINLEKGINSKGTLVLSDIIENLIYIPLETNNKNLISFIQYLKFSDEFFFIQNHKPPKLLLFNRSGKFINELGNLGKGPKEFTFITSFSFNNKNAFLYCTMPEKIMVFDFNGLFVNNFKCNEFQPVNDIEFLSDEYYILFMGNYEGRTPFSYRIFSVDNELIKEIIKPKQFSMGGGRFAMKNEFSYYRYDSMIYVKENLQNDTLYEITPKTDFSPRLLFYSGKYQCPGDYRINFHSYWEKKDFNYIILWNIFETPSFLIYRFYFNGNTLLGYFDKLKKRTYTYSSDGIPNDFDGGLDFKPLYQNDKELIGYINAMDLISHVNSETFKNSTPKYPDKKKELEQLTNTLNENDNPVLMLVKLKE